MNLRRGTFFFIFSQQNRPSGKCEERKRTFCCTIEHFFTSSFGILQKHYGVTKSYLMLILSLNKIVIVQDIIRLSLEIIKVDNLPPGWKIEKPTACLITKNGVLAVLHMYFTVEILHLLTWLRPLLRPNMNVKMEFKINKEIRM